jgi:lipopolysaccharide/colanic/teichoic acid biosynthesis glycosyltransferase
MLLKNKNSVAKPKNQNDASMGKIKKCFRRHFDFWLANIVFIVLLVF